MRRIAGACALAFLLSSLPARPQVIEFESNGLKYQTLTRSGVTIMFASLPDRLHEYAIIQVSVSNGSRGPYVIRPEDFSFTNVSGKVQAASAGYVVDILTRKGSRNDILKVVSTYESTLYGSPKIHSTNGYEQRRQAAMLYGSNRLRAAAAASALALVQTKLMPGQSTDGAVFFPTQGRPLGPGVLIVQTNTDLFRFNPN